MERRLAAILAVDVVGYSRLMEQDEAGTFARLRDHRKELFEPEIAGRHGHIFKLTGDGLLAEFASVVEAVECAVALQEGMTRRNAASPSEHRIEARIGINLGDVIVEKEDSGAVDMHGEGVIIADRLQALAEPGGICVSQTVVSHVGHKVAVDFDFVGKQRVKNIAEPVRIYRVLTGLGRAQGRRIRKPSRHRWHWPLGAIALVLVAMGAVVLWELKQPAPEPAPANRTTLPLPDKPSIAVLPFTNMSDDPKQQFFADGMTDDLITALSQVSGLFVISRNSTFVYMGKSVSPKQVSEELGVRYVLEGSVQRAGDQLRINAQLIDALSGGHEWAGKFDGSIADVFALQDKVARSVADALAVRLTDAEQIALSQQETEVPAAYEAFLRGWEDYRRTTPEDFARAIPNFEEAIKLDPEYSRAHAALAMIYVASSDRGWWGSLGISASEAFQKAQDHLSQAKERPTSTYYQAAGSLFRQKSASLAIGAFKRAIALDPSDSWSYTYLALAQIDAGHSTDAISNITTAMRLDPHYPPLFSYILGIAQLRLSQLAEAATSLERAARLNPEDEYPYLALAATYAYLDRNADAFAAVNRYNGIRVRRGGVPLSIDSAPSVTLSEYSSDPVLTKGLRLARVPETLQASEFTAKNRLTGEDVRRLFYGHRLNGRTLESGEEHKAAFTAGGVAALSGDWGETVDATVTFTANEACFAAAGGVRFCATILRNPGGSRTTMNEFIWLDQTGAYPFSQLD
jgi:TolB-like protein/class 3 adenylate cyclase/Tfp pilus assembly protein PilF